jgi:hypothetical protein
MAYRLPKLVISLLSYSKKTVPDTQSAIGDIESSSLSEKNSIELKYFQEKFNAKWK